MAKLVSLEEETPLLRLLLYGLPGSGKTRTSYTAALDDRSFPTLVLDAAGNPESARDYDRLPDIIRIEELKDVNAPYDWLVKGQPANHPLTRQFDLQPPYKCVIVDQLTDIQRLSFAQVTGSTKVGPGDYPSRVERQHFGSVLGQMVNFSRLYFSLPLHVIMTCQEQARTNEATGAVSYSPLLWGQSDREVPGYAHMVGRLVHKSVLKRSDQRALGDDVYSVCYFEPDGRFVAKDIWGVMAALEPALTITTILDKLEKPNE